MALYRTSPPTSPLQPNSRTPIAYLIPSNRPFPSNSFAAKPHPTYVSFCKVLGYSGLIGDLVSMSASGSSLGNLIQTSSPVEGVRVITFNRPQKRNALSTELLTEFLAELSVASKDAAIKVIVLTGSGGFFSGELWRALIRNFEVYRNRPFLSTHLILFHVFPRPAGDGPPTDHDRGPGSA